VSSRRPPDASPPRASVSIRIRIVAGKQRGVFNVESAAVWIGFVVAIVSPMIDDHNQIGGGD
jgi:hypothetical protein